MYSDGHADGNTVLYCGMPGLRNHTPGPVGLLETFRRVRHKHFIVIAWRDGQWREEAPYVPGAAAEPTLL